MTTGEAKSGSIDVTKSQFEVEINPDLQGFQEIVVTSVDESLPYKPPKTVEVTFSNGDKAEMDAATTYASLIDEQGAELTVSAAAAGHIHELHISGTESGSQFDVESLDELLRIVAEHIPEEVAQTPGVSAFSVETGRAMGNEGVSSLEELLEKGLIEEADVDNLAEASNQISELNKTGTVEAKKEFVESYNDQHAESKIKLELIRGGIIIPKADAPKQPTTELFMVFGQGQTGKTMYTMAPGRDMPKMPNPKEHLKPDGSIDEASFKASSEAWLSTVMLA